MNSKEEITKDNETKSNSKRRYSIYVKESTIELVKELYEKDGCKCPSDFVEKAIKFFMNIFRSVIAPMSSRTS